MYRTGSNSSELFFTACTSLISVVHAWYLSHYNSSQYGYYDDDDYNDDDDDDDEGY